MSDSLILTKAKAFAIRAVKLHKYLRGKREATMSKQILRCGTSIGANLAEAKYAQSMLGEKVNTWHEGRMTPCFMFPVCCCRWW